MAKTKAKPPAPLEVAVAERERFRNEAQTYKRLYENQQGYNDKIAERLRHSERLVRTLLDALADKYHPVPTNITVSMDYRVAKPGCGEGEAK